MEDQQRRGDLRCRRLGPQHCRQRRDSDAHLDARCSTVAGERRTSVSIGGQQKRCDLSVEAEGIVRHRLRESRKCAYFLRQSHQAWRDLCRCHPQPASAHGGDVCPRIHQARRGGAALARCWLGRSSRARRHRAARAHNADRHRAARRQHRKQEHLRRGARQAHGRRTGQRTSCGHRTDLATRIARPRHGRALGGDRRPARPAQFGIDQPDRRLRTFGQEPSERGRHRALDRRHCARWRVDAQLHR